MNTTCNLCGGDGYTRIVITLKGLKYETCSSCHGTGYKPYVR
jgi:DnaJ-class molecular chaperone